MAYLIFLAGQRFKKGNILPRESNFDGITDIFENDFNSTNVAAYNEF